MGIREQAKEEKRQLILRTALNLFSEHGIEQVSMEQICQNAGIGSATIYRYFPTKAQLSCQTAIMLWNDMKVKYLPQLETAAFSKKNGREQLRTILLIFPAIFEEYPSFLRFLSDFDSYIQSEEINQAELSDYESFIEMLKSYAVSSIQAGIEDHTISCTVSVNELYFTIFHCMLSLTQKLALHGDLLFMDKLVPGKTQLLLMIDLLLSGLTP